MLIQSFQGVSCKARSHSPGGHRSSRPGGIPSPPILLPARSPTRLCGLQSVLQGRLGLAGFRAPQLAGRPALERGISPAARNGTPPSTVRGIRIPPLPYPRTMATSAYPATPTSPRYSRTPLPTRPPLPTPPVDSGPSPAAIFAFRIGVPLAIFALLFGVLALFRYKARAKVAFEGSAPAEQDGLSRAVFGRGPAQEAGVRARVPFAGLGRWWSDRRRAREEAHAFGSGHGLVTLREGGLPQGVDMPGEQGRGAGGRGDQVEPRRPPPAATRDRGPGRAGQPARAATLAAPYPHGPALARSSTT
ncbi:hypothetical protein DFJ74DRAFT_195182 [Hyaloraphidium curvatum]|nr:hypothetical protein DFJ74DRAFT_195182 [Hyaloraphidium curvatum]